MKKKTTRQKLIRQVLSGAIHPIILVERAIREHAKSSVGNLPGLIDISNKPFPWDNIQWIRENIAFICQGEIWHFYQSSDHYYKDVDRIKDWVVGDWATFGAQAMQDALAMKKAAGKTVPPNVSKV